MTDEELEAMEEAYQAARLLEWEEEEELNNKARSMTIDQLNGVQQGIDY